MKARPKRAGLKILKPNPPNICFPRAIAKIAPVTGNHQGEEELILKAIRIPVTTALPSPIVIGTFLYF